MKFFADTADIDDIKDLAVPVLAHRVVVGTDGRLGGVAAEETILVLLRSTPVPS